jgi:hypothetical protein
VLSHSVIGEVPWLAAVPHELVDVEELQGMSSLRGEAKRRGTEGKRRGKEEKRRGEEEKEGV